MNKLYYLLLIILIVCLFLPYRTNYLENLINFTPPLNSDKKDKEIMAELMRIGSQGIENAQFDTVDTNYLK